MLEAPRHCRVDEILQKYIYSGWLRFLRDNLELKVSIVLDGTASAGKLADLARLAEQNKIECPWFSAGSRTKDHS